MSFPFVAQARDSINKAYVALQNWNTNPADIPLPDVVNTRRPQMTQEQKAAAYLKSVQGNPDIDINKIPKMKSIDRIDFDLPITDEKPSTEINPEKQKRQIYQHCKGNWYFEAKESVESSTHLEFNWIGSLKHRFACTDGVPEFIICSDQYLGETFLHRMIHNDFILDYRNVSGLYTGFGECGPVWTHKECPPPATEIDEINQQIDDAIKQHRQVKIYLNETDLNNYLEFRNETGELENFNYILISDKPSTSEKLAPDELPAPEKEPNPKPTEPNRKPTETSATAALVIGGALTGFATALLAWGAIKLRSRNTTNNGASTTTTVPAQALQTAQTGLSTSPANATAPNLTTPTATTAALMSSAIGASPTTTAANPAGTTAQQSSSSSDDDSDSVALDIPPAGHEDD